jgi:hypothetical protein
MNAKSRNLIIIICIAALFGVTYAVHLDRVSKAKEKSARSESHAEDRFEEQKTKLKSKFERENPGEGYLFDELFDAEKAISFIDTAVSFFVYSEHFEVKLLDEKYLDCVYLKATSEAINKRSDKAFEEQLNSLSEKHGSNASAWVNKLGKERFLDLTEKNECKPYFEHNNSYVVNPISFTEFDRFLVEYKMYEQKMNLINEQTTRKYEAELSALRRGLNADARSVMDRTLNSESALRSTDEEFSFNWSGHGNLDFSLPKKEIDRDYIDQAMNEVYAEQYKDYSLQNGSMPYGYCYGTSNYGRSGVKVNAGGSDVLVTIKNMNDQVIRHAYIKSRRSYTLNLPDGNYQVYFYYGTGWNPKRFMKDTDCGRLVGGFLSNESVSKDPNTLRLYSGVMEYTLTEQIGGNFSTAGSSKMEAF